jgi:hypothetical protein
MADATFNKINNGRVHMFYSSEHSDPDALVILNRGTEFEQDVTGDLIAFNTNNSIDSITGSFTVTLDNKNDHLVNRFNFSKIKKMSSIEIFVKPLQNDTSAKDPNAGSQTIMIPQKSGSEKQTLNKVIDDTYGSGITPDQRNNILRQIRDMNSMRTAPVLAMRIDKQGMFRQGYDLTRTETPLDTRLLFSKIADSNSNFTMILAKGINDIYSEDAFQLSFYSTGVKTPAEAVFFIKNIVAEKTIPLPSDPDAELGDTDRSISLKVPIPPNLYQRVFFGVVLNVNNSVAPAGGLTVNLNGKGVGYWLEASVINLNPGGYEQTVTGLNLSVFANRFAERKALDIFRELLSVSTGDLPATTNLNLNTLQTSAEYLQLRGEPDPNNPDNNLGSTLKNLYGGSLRFLDENGDEITDRKITLRSTTNPQKINELNYKLERVYKGFALQSDAATPDIKTTLKDKDWLALSIEYNKNAASLKTAADKLVSLNTKIDQALANGQSSSDVDKKYKKDLNAIQSNVNSLEKKRDELREKLSKNDRVKEQIEAVEVTRKEIQDQMQVSLSTSGRTNFLKQFGIIQHWKKIFAQLILEVMDNDSFLNNIYPFNYMFKEPQPSLDGDYVSKATLGQQIADYLNYEFYFDANGHFVLKPPLYHLDYDDTNALYIINDDDVVSFSCNDTVDGIITRIGVAGDYRESPGIEKTIIYNIFQDMRLIRDYGFHAKEINNLYFINNNSDARDFGQSFMARNNMNLFNASVTINGRPGMRIGTVVYLKPRDTVYYIREISHEFSVGGTFQTTLTLIGGRRILQGFPSTSEITKFERVRTDIFTQNGQRTSGTVNREVGKYTITHYILSDGFNAESIAENEIAQGIPDGQQQQAANTQAAVGGGPTKEKQSIILRNAYQISSHYNQALIGLIVLPEKDQSNNAIADINIANYNFLKNLSVTSVPPVTNVLDLSATKKQKAIDIIGESFDIFLAERDITKDNAGSKFTVLVKDEFVRSFLKEMQDAITEDGGLSKAIKIQYQDASIIFNRIINDLDNNGTYKQITDQTGRELPAYQNFGLSLYIQNSSFAVNSAVENTNLLESARNNATKENAIKQAARSLSGTHNPNGEALKKILEINFKKYSFDSVQQPPTNEGKQPGASQ